jgi:hypothetical protein
MIRMLLRIMDMERIDRSAVKVTEQEAIAKAKNIAEEGGLRWEEPISAFLCTEKDRIVWYVWAFNVWIKLDSETGELLEKGVDTVIV